MYYLFSLDLLGHFDDRYRLPSRLTCFFLGEHLRLAKWVEDWGDPRGCQGIEVDGVGAVSVFRPVGTLASVFSAGASSNFHQFPVKQKVKQEIPKFAEVPFKTESKAPTTW